MSTTASGADPDFLPPAFVTGRPDTAAVWCQLSQINDRAGGCGHLWLSADVKLLAMACLQLLKQHRPDGVSCTQCRGSSGHLLAWPCPVWRHLHEWLVSEDTIEVA